MREAAEDEGWGGARDQVDYPNADAVRAYETERPDIADAVLNGLLLLEVLPAPLCPTRCPVLVYRR
eukprot:3163657-Rhodomonas_salina.1